MGEPLAQPLRVRYHECDAQGVVFNAHYLAWFDMNMTELWRAAFGGYQSVVERGVDIVVVTAELTFRAPARFDDLLELEVVVSGLGNTSITTRHAARRDGRLLVEGTIRHVTVDAAAMTKITLPGWVREGLRAWTRTDAARDELATR